MTEWTIYGYSHRPGKSDLVMVARADGGRITDAEHDGLRALLDGTQVARLTAENDQLRRDLAIAVRRADGRTP